MPNRIVPVPNMLLIVVLPDDLEFRRYYSKTRRELFLVSKVQKSWFFQTRIYGHLINNFLYDPDLLKLEPQTMTKYCFPSDRYVVSYEKPTLAEAENFYQILDSLSQKFPEYQQNIQKIAKTIHF